MRCMQGGEAVEMEVDTAAGCTVGTPVVVGVTALFVVELAVEVVLVVWRQYLHQLPYSATWL